MDDLSTIAKKMLVTPKGLLAADESNKSISKRFEGIGVESTEENRRAFRELLFTTPGIEQYLSGAILYDETIHQKTRDGIPFIELLNKRGIIPGIKVDKGTKPLPMFPGESITEGLDGLRERLKEYAQLGAQFAKWRAVISIVNGTVSRQCIYSNAEALALYASYCQEAGLVPIVEPEVLMDGDHDIATCESVTSDVLDKVFSVLYSHRILFDGMLLKPNMVVPGKGSKVNASDKQIAEATLRVLRYTVPAAVPGIVFLSGGQSPEEASGRLNQMNTLGAQPWRVTFSFSRALQTPALNAWKGNPANVNRAQQLFLHRCKCVSAASQGSYKDFMEKEI